eukprot:jgi/Tetstr1/431180/TSEL_020892.t1
MVAVKAVKAVFFDLDDTLAITSGYDKVAWKAVGELAMERNDKVSAAQLIEDFRKLFGTKPWDTTHKVPVTKWRAGLWLEALQKQSIDDEPLSEALQAKYDEVRYSLFEFVDGVEDMVKELEAAGLAVVIITNGHHKVQRDKLEACNAYRLFHHIIVGGEEVYGGRMEKPDAAIFHKACQYVGCSASEAVHVGDSLGSDIGGAINAGLAASIWINPEGTPAPEGKPQPTYVARIVTETPSIIAKMQQAAA